MPRTKRKPGGRDAESQQLADYRSVRKRTAPPTRVQADRRAKLERRRARREIADEPERAPRRP